MSRIWALLLAALATLVAPTDARATVVVGTASQLLAIGANGSIAIVMDYDLQEDETHLVYQVPLQRGQFLRQFRQAIQRQAGAAHPADPSLMLNEYLKRLPEPQQKQLSQGLLRELEAVEVVDNSGTADPARARVELAAGGYAELVQLWSTASMAMYDRSDPNDYDLCFAHGAPQCSSCKPTVRWLNGEKLDTWECATTGTKLPRDAHGTKQAGNRIPCRCDARALMYQLVLHRAGAHSAGAKVLAEPYQTFQPGGGQPPDVTLGLRTGTGSSALQFFRTPTGGIIAVGAATHAPHANGTYFPVFAFIP